MHAICRLMPNCPSENENMLHLQLFVFCVWLFTPCAHLHRMDLDIICMSEQKCRRLSSKSPIWWILCRAFRRLMICQGYTVHVERTWSWQMQEGHVTSSPLSSIHHPLCPRRTRWVVQIGWVTIPPKHGANWLVQLKVDDAFVDAAGICTRKIHVITTGQNRKPLELLESRSFDLDLLHFFNGRADRLPFVQSSVSYIGVFDDARGPNPWRLNKASQKGSITSLPTPCLIGVWGGLGCRLLHIYRSCLGCLSYDAWQVTAGHQEMFHRIRGLEWVVK